MSKKSRKRNKKILAALALAGGAALMARKGKGVAQGVSGSDKAKFTSDAAYKLPAKNWITQKAADVTSPISKNIIRTRHRLIDSAGNTIPKNHMANIAAMNAPNVVSPFNINRNVGFANPRRPGGKKGGRVTGIAKRGFGRALMKGKK